MSLIVVAFLLGVGTGLAGAHSYRDLRHKLSDAKLSTDNNYLHEEVKRLRAQVALHINPVASPEGRNNPALVAAAR